MPNLFNNTHYRQAYENSCWACCTRYVNNFYGNEQQQIVSDDAMAARVGKNVNSEASIKEVLDQVHMSDGQDSEFIPQLQEIKDEIDNNRMVVVCVSSQRHGYLNRDPIVGGHYVVIMGYNGNQITIMDPALNQIYTQEYHQTVYSGQEQAMYWCGTDYTNGDPAH